jgi:hypothetical protein
VSLGHVTNKGTPAVATTARYTQPNHEQMKHKLKDILLSISTKRRERDGEMA